MSSPHAPYQSAPLPSSSYRTALRVATAIAIVKWFLIALAVLATIGLPIYQLSTDAGSGFEEVAGLIVAAIVVVGLLLILLIWVIFGWFEHVLRLLVAIADHTRR